MYEDRTVGNISTGSFFAYNNRNDYYRVSIANSTPRGMIVDYTWKNVQPGWDLVKTYKDGYITAADYTVGYNNLLINGKEVLRHQLDELRLKSEGRPIVLLCWEKEGDFCHRHLLLDFLIKIGAFVSN